MNVAVPGPEPGFDGGRFAAMTPSSELIPRDRFEPLPQPRTASGEERRVGVEVEFAGLTEAQVSELVARRFGGAARPAGPFERVVEGTALGSVEVFLDTAFRKGRHGKLVQLGLELGREVIPVEIVTEPLRPAALEQVEALCAALREAGAVGSGGGLFFGFGMHLNVEVAAAEMGAIRPVLTAFALLEDWLRLSRPIDASRRLLPFVDPYPRRFVRGLLALPPEAGLGELIALYLKATPSRNRSLDLLPLIRHLDEVRLLAALPDAAAVSARPAWHYRLPDSRVDEPDWRIAYEWNRWVLVERVAGDGALLARLAEDWLAYHRAGAATRRGWCDRVEALLRAAPPLERPA